VKDHSEEEDRLTVRSGAGSQFRKIDRLHSGRKVYICDERGGWFKIFYSNPQGPCGPTFSNGLGVHKTAGCKSGWVEQKWIEVISG
ncbi:MAG: SH3 domain-containing protein, partial [bacterium]